MPIQKFKTQSYIYVHDFNLFPSSYSIKWNIDTCTKSRKLFKFLGPDHLLPLLLKKVRTSTDQEACPCATIIHAVLPVVSFAAGNRQINPPLPPANRQNRQK